MHRLLAVLAAGLCALAPAPAPAQAYPSKTVKIVVGTSPGGSPDVFARLIAQNMSESWGAVVVENRIGANGNIAATAPQDSLIFCAIRRANTSGEPPGEVPTTILTVFDG